VIKLETALYSHTNIHTWEYNYHQLLLMIIMY